MPSAMNAALGALSAERSGAGSAVITAFRQVGATLGAAILGTVLSSAYQARLDLAGLPAAAAGAVRSGISGGVAVAARLGSASLLHDRRRRVRARPGRDAVVLRGHRPGRGPAGAGLPAAQRGRAGRGGPASRRPSRPGRSRQPPAGAPAMASRPGEDRMTTMSEGRRPGDPSASASARRPGRVLPSGSTRSGCSASRATTPRPSSRSPRRPRSRRARSSGTSRPRRTWSSRTTSTSSPSPPFEAQPAGLSPIAAFRAAAAQVFAALTAGGTGPVPRDHRADPDRPGGAGPGRGRVRPDDRRDRGGDRAADRARPRRLRRAEHGRGTDRRRHVGDACPGPRRHPRPTCSSGSTRPWRTWRPACRCERSRRERGLSQPRQPQRERQPGIDPAHGAGRQCPLHPAQPIPEHRPDASQFTQPSNGSWPLASGT